MKEMLKKTCEILLKPYSENVLGYIARFDYSKHMSEYIVINSNLTEPLKGVVQSKLNEYSVIFPNDKFILLHDDFQIHKTENLNLSEMSEQL